MKKVLILAVAAVVLTTGSALAHKHKRHHHRQIYVTGGEVYPPAVYRPGPYRPRFTNAPQSPVDAYSGDVTHRDEHARGLVPGNPNADGGEKRNQF